MQKIKFDIQLFADGKVVIDTDLNESGFKNGLSQMQKIAKTGFKAAATSVGVVSTAMATAVGFGVKYNSTIEQLATSFEVMTGSSEKATDLVEKLKKVGAETPYELEGLASTVQLLMQYGMTADEAYNSTLSLGDIAQGSAEKMQGIALALGQMSSYGKVTLQDIKQMIGNGFNPLQEISEATGESMQSLYDRISAGTLSVDEIKTSFQRASAEGGKFYQSMEKQSRTVAGQFSTLKDNVSSLAGTLTQGISNSISGEVLPSINELLQTLETAFSEEGFAGFSEALGQGIANMITTIAEQAPSFIDSALLIIQNFITGIQNNLPEIAKSAVSIVMQLLMGVLDMLPEILQLGIDLVVELVLGIAESADELIPKIVETMLQLFMIITDPENLEKIINAGITLIIALIDGIIKSIPKLIENGETILMALVNILSGGQVLMLKIGWALLKSIIQGLIEKIPELKNKANEIIDNLKQKLYDGISKIKDVGKQLIQGLWNGLKEKWNNLKSSVENLGNGIVNKFKSVFGIHSPSRVFRDEIGKYLAQGVGVGFEGELDSVYNDMQRAIDLETSKMSANVEASGTYQMAMAGTPTFNLLDNSEHSTQLVVNGKVLAEVVNTENRNREVASA